MLFKVFISSVYLLYTEPGWLSVQYAVLGLFCFRMAPEAIELLLFYCSAKTTA